MFNALKYTKDLEAAGFSRKQAEATIEVFFKFMEHNFATKEDIMALDGKFESQFSTIRQEIKDLDARFESKFVSVRQEIKGLDAA